MRQLLVMMLLGTIAQPVAAAQPEQPRFELGATGGVIVPFDEIISVGSRLSVNVTERAGIDVVGDVIVLNEHSSTYHGIYGIQFRQMIREGRPNRSAIFVTGGVSGDFLYARVPETRVPRPDGSVVVYRGYSRGEMSSPAALSVGVGMQRVLARYAALRIEAQMIIPVRGTSTIRSAPGIAGALRGALGISVPIRGHYATDPQ